MQERIKREEKARKRKRKAALNKRKSKRKLNDPKFDLELPEDEDGLDSNYWIDSLINDGETVVESLDREDIQEDSEEEEASNEVMRVKEVVDGATDEDIKSAIRMIKISHTRIQDSRSC